MKFLTITAGCVLTAFTCLFLSRKLIHLYQLENYQLPGFFKSVRRSLKRTLLIHLLLVLAAAVLSWAGVPVLVCVLLQAAGSFAYYKAVEGQKEKKPFHCTERVKRFGLVHLGVGLIAAAAACCLGIPVFIVPGVEILLFALSAAAAVPIEKQIAGQFVNDAKRRLAEIPALRVIGITGSYGKTSTKFILQTILSTRWKVLATPGSFNTTMGVTRVIREMLTPGYDIFIAEMGARHIGDIRELCDLVHPEIGMITAVGPQHLDTFGTVEQVAKAKYELIEGLPRDGMAFFADDGGLCRQLYEKCPLEHKFLSDGVLEAGRVRVGPKGTAFVLRDRETGEEAACQTRLLGEHAISNILLSAVVARKLGMTLEEIARGISQCRPVEHRLQLLTYGNGITVIDDAFNSNPAGARAAARVLGQFEGRRIIVTPGMVELGEKEHEYNVEFGRQIAENADIAILVGNYNAKSITEGILESGCFDRGNLHYANQLSDATELLQRLLQAGDVVLYENDLPDNYS